VAERRRKGEKYATLHNNWQMKRALTAESAKSVKGQKKDNLKV